MNKNIAHKISFY